MIRCQVTAVILSRGRLSGTARGITSAAGGLGMDHRWTEVLAVGFPEGLPTQPRAMEKGPGCGKV